MQRVGSEVVDRAHSPARFPRLCSRGCTRPSFFGGGALRCSSMTGSQIRYRLSISAPWHLFIVVCFSAAGFKPADSCPTRPSEARKRVSGPPSLPADSILDAVSFYFRPAGTAACSVAFVSRSRAWLLDTLLCAIVGTQYRVDYRVVTYSSFLPLCHLPEHDVAGFPHAHHPVPKSPF